MDELSSHQASRLVLVPGMAGLLSAADNWVAAPLLPSMAASFGVSASAAGFALVAYLVPYGFMQPVCGFLADRWGKLRMLKLIVLGLALGTLLCACAPSFPLFCMARAATGFFAAGIIAVSLALIGDTLPPVERQRGVARFMGLVFLGQGLSAGFGGVLAHALSWRAALLLVSLLAFVSAFSLRSLKLDARPVRAASGGGLLSETAKAFHCPKGRVIFPMAFGVGFLLIGVYSYLGAYLATCGMNALKIGFILMAFGFSCLLFGRFAGELSNRFGRASALASGAALALVATALLAFLSSSLAALVSALLLGAAYIFLQSTLATAAFEVSSDAKGLPSALIGLGLFGGGGLGGAFASWLLSFRSFSTLFLCFATLELPLLGAAIFCREAVKPSR